MRVSRVWKCMTRNVGAGSGKRLGRESRVSDWESHIHAHTRTRLTHACMHAWHCMDGRACAHACTGACAHDYMPGAHTITTDPSLLV